MPIGSKSQRDTRRRRVLMDEVSDSPSAKSTQIKSVETSTSASPDTPHQRYTPEALAENHLPISWLVPKKWWVLGTILFSFAAIGALINYLHVLSQRWSDTYGATHTVAFDLSTDAGIMRWLTSMLLALSAFYCMQVFVMRRHRCDDYRGTYRVWPWIAALLVFFSLDATANISGFLFAISAKTQYVAFIQKSQAGWFAVTMAALASMP